MCLVLPSRVVSRSGDDVEVELADGEHATANASLRPEVSVGDYVLVDRGVVVEVIEEAEALAIIEMYREIGDMLAAQDAAAALEVERE